MPSHNIYVPVAHTIMPRPKLYNMTKEDQTGKDYTYRTRDEHTPQVAFTRHNSLKPQPLSPAPPKQDLSVYAH
jgi:hypothetical protein